MAATAKNTISIVTAAYNCAGLLPPLIESLRRQTDTDFDWVVADGGSSDGTVELLCQVSDLKLVISSQADLGVYDALNRAIRLCSGRFYIVAGSDDRFFPDAIANFRRVIDGSNADVIAASAKDGDRYIRVRRGPRWLFGAHVLISNHSLATAIRKDLHERFGFYSRKFPIAADALFIITACNAGAVRARAEFVAGEVGPSGLSAVNWVESATEFFRVQLLTGCSLPMQMLLLFARLVKGSNSGLTALWRRYR